MASSVFYKFRSQKNESRVTFDGTGISVFDLKRDIILANNLGKANDFDLVVYDAATNQEFKDDSEIIPRSSSVIVKRVPAAKPGKGRAAIYTAGATNAIPTSEPVYKPGNHSSSMTWHKGSMSKRFDVKEEPIPIPSKSTTPLPTIIKTLITKEDEAAAMAAMFQAQTANWEETQEKMSQLVLPYGVFLFCIIALCLINMFSHSMSLLNMISATKIYTNTRGTGFGRGGKPITPHPHHHDRPLPPSYVCYRCGQKGHWIQDCPTNNDREYDHRPRIKRTTGIPRSMLKAVENPSNGQIGQGIMVTPEGGYVVAQPDSASWQKQVSRPKGLTAAEVREKTPSDSSLVCPIDNKLFRDAVKTPCCGTQYCEECIQTHLLEKDFICPTCGKKVASLDKLVIDKPMRTKVTDYIEKAIEESRKAGPEEEFSTNRTALDDQAASAQDATNLEQDLYSEQQPGAEMDMSQMIGASIPQLQAQISQISLMLQNPSLPPQVRQTTEMQYQQLQMELQQAQTFSAALVVATTLQQQQQQQQQQQAVQNVNGGGVGYNMQGYQQTGYQNWNNQYVNQQSVGQDSAYQRLPLNNRRRNLKRERPSDFLEVAGEDSKTPRYWE